MKELITRWQSLVTAIARNVEQLQYSALPVLMGISWIPPIYVLPACQTAKFAPLRRPAPLAIHIILSTPTVIPARVTSIVQQLPIAPLVIFLQDAHNVFRDIMSQI
jgi:hypothetical protein